MKSGRINPMTDESFGKLEELFVKAEELNEKVEELQRRGASFYSRWGLYNIQPI